MQALLSEHWHAVRSLRPRLREGVQPLHRRLRGHGWVLLLDPITQRFHRLTPAVWRVLQLLDGRRTLDEVWHAACSAPDATAPISQHELVRLLASLHANDLLQSQVAPDAGEVLERYRRTKRQRVKQNWLNPMSVRLPLLHPDAWFERHAGLARTLMSWPMLILWTALVLPGAALAWQHWHALTDHLADRVLAAHNVLLIALVYPVVKAVHEWAHGLAVKAFGGTVREVGLMFVVFMPVPYVDATSSYRFASKWQRALVAAAGIMAELMIGAIAMLVWLNVGDGWVHTVAYNVVLIAGASTLFINGNPLMRYDGYFVLCDLIEVPNLGQRAAQYWTYLIDRYGFGSRDAEAPLQVRGERALLAVYGIASPLYRLAITVGLVWFVASEYLFIGVVMALMAAWAAFVLPLWKGWKHLRESAALARRRGVALRRTLLLLLLAGGGFALVPLPFHSVHPAVVWVPDDAIVRAGAAGQVRPGAVARGQGVQAGERLLVLDNPLLVAEAAAAAAAVAQTEAELRRAEVMQPARNEVLRGELAARRAKLEDARSRIVGLEVRAGAAGRWLPGAETELAGRHVKRGERLGVVVAAPSATVRTAVSQDDMELIRSRAVGVQVRLAHAPETAVAARLVRVVPGGEFELVSPALGTAGGGEIAVDPTREGGTHTLERVFDLEVGLDAPSSAAVFGERAHVRFDLGTAPLAWQWTLRLRQLFLSRLQV